MDKQLQFITYKVGLALSLSLVLINQLSASAETASDKTKWLTNNLDNVKQTNIDQPTTLKALSAQEDNRQKPIAFRASNSSRHTIKMRPFKANRRLPSRHELELALIEQKAKLAEETNARLNGQVSAFAVGADNNNPAAAPWSTAQYNLSQASNKNYSSGNYSRQPAPKSRPANFSFIKQAEQHLLSNVMPQANNSATPTSNIPVSNPLNNMSNIIPMAGPPNPMLESSPSTMPARAMDTYSSDLNSPMGLPALPNSGSEINQPTLSGLGTAGPPPFPLSLLPEATLKQLIRSMAIGRGSHASNAPRAAFGSWRGNGGYNNLSYGGFQSHLTARPLPSSSIATYHVCTLPALTTSPMQSKVRQQKAPTVSRPKDTAARNRMLIESQVKVAAYPSYTTQSLRSWNFAQ